MTSLFTIIKVDSTNRLASDLWRQGQGLPFGVLAQQQTAGRGQRGRSFVSPVGGIYLSVVFAPGLALTLVPLHLGLVVAQWLEQVTGVVCQLKWPNDLQVAGAKLGGILCERITYQGLDAIVAGVGLNVVNSPMIDGVAVCNINEASGRYDEPAELGRSLYDFLLQNLTVLQAAQIDPRVYDYLDLTRHQFFVGDQCWQGMRLTAEGFLVVVDKYGQESVWVTRPQLDK